MKKYVEVDREPNVGDMVKVVKTTLVPKTDGVDDYKVQVGSVAVFHVSITPQIDGNVNTYGSKRWYDWVSARRHHGII